MTLTSSGLINIADCNSEWASWMGGLKLSSFNDNSPFSRLQKNGIDEQLADL